MTYLVSAAIFFFLLSLILAYALVHARRQAGQVSGLESARQELAQRVSELDGQNRFFGKLIRDYLGFTRQLHRVSSLREIPELLLKFMVWLFEPEEAVVLIRRLPAVADSNREHQLIVAASRGYKVHKRTVIPISDGPLSRVASTGIVLEERFGSGTSELPGFDPDLAVPLAVEEEILGVLALMHPGQQRPHARELLQLFAQSATLAHKNAATLNRIRSEADVDPLTGVLNRGALMALLEEFGSDAKEHGRPLTAFLFDIDHFKNYNDTNGHLAGDDCLRLLARLVAEQTRRDDAFGRYGGEEFLLLFPGREASEARPVAEKIRALVAGYPFPYGETQPLECVTISGGIACLPDHADDTSALLEAADQALYAAKSAGRNRVQVKQVEHEERVPVAEVPRPAEEDDFRQIRGIGERYDQLLQEMGIRNYRQIAELDWRGICRLSSQLGTNPERIVREEWLSQARRLHREKYDEDLEPLV